MIQNYNKKKVNFRKKIIKKELYLFDYYSIIEAIKKKQAKIFFIKNNILKYNYKIKKINNIIIKFNIKKKIIKNIFNNNIFNKNGFALLVNDYKYLNFKDLLEVLVYKKKFLILDKLEDSYNFGAIIRTAVSVGIYGIIISKKKFVYINSIVAKVSVGAIYNIKIFMVSNILNVINIMKKKYNFWILGSDVNGNIDFKNNKFKNNNFKKFIVLVIGNEHKGISYLVKKNIDFMLKIPMSSKIQSLNTSVAAALLMYQIYYNIK